MNKCKDIPVDSEENRKIKRMDISEFRELGYLQEVNRRFFHPLGLALEIMRDENGVETLASIWDNRLDDEGIYYDLKNADGERLQRFNKNRDFIENEINKRLDKRLKMFNGSIEPIPKN